VDRRERERERCGERRLFKVVVEIWGLPRNWREQVGHVLSRWGFGIVVEKWADARTGPKKIEWEGEK